MSTKEYQQYILNDVLSHIGGISSKAMFGGYGLYRNGVVIGMIIDDTLYFKVGDSNRNEYEAAGSTPFMYKRSGQKAIAMSYWKVPADIIEDKQKIKEWLEKSYDASIQFRAKKSSKK